MTAVAPALSAFAAFLFIFCEAAGAIVVLAKLGQVADSACAVQQNIKLEKQKKRASAFPQRKFAVKA